MRTNRSVSIFKATAGCDWAGAGLWRQHVNGMPGRLAVPQDDDKRSVCRVDKKFGIAHLTVLPILLFFIERYRTL